MPKTPIIPTGSPPPLAPYSPGVRAGNTVYVSGMLAIGADGVVIGAGDVRAQTKAVLEAIEAVLIEAGGTMDDVVLNSIFLKDLADYKAMNEVYGACFATNPPARYCIQAELVRPEFLVEISVIAHI